MKKSNKKINLSRSYLLGAAYRYLEKYATTKANLEVVLKRKVQRIAFKNDQAIENIAEIEGWIDEIVETCVKGGLVDDKLYAQSKVRSFIASGNSLGIIKQKLRAKGVPADIIEDVIGKAKKETPNINLVSAIKYAKRRRFGAFRIREKNEKTDGKEQGAMARAGFSFEESQKVLKSVREELEDILYDA